MLKYLNARNQSIRARRRNIIINYDHGPRGAQKKKKKWKCEAYCGFAGWLVCFQGGLSKAVKYNLQKRMARVIVIAGRVSLSHLIYHTAAGGAADGGHHQQIKKTPHIRCCSTDFVHSANLPSNLPRDHPKGIRVTRPLSLGHNGRRLLTMTRKDLCRKEIPHPLPLSIHSCTLLI